MGLLSQAVLGFDQVMYSHAIKTKGKAVTIYLYENGKRKVDYFSREKSFQDAKKDFNNTLKKMGIRYVV